MGPICPPKVKSSLSFKTMYISKTTTRVGRAGKKTSEFPTLLGLIIAFAIIILLIEVISYNKNANVTAPISPNTDTFLEKYSQRLSELSTWPSNKSVIITDYLNLTSSSTFLVQPQVYINNNATSPFCGPDVKILVMVTSAPYNSRRRQAIRDTWGSMNNITSKGVRLAFILGRSANVSVQDSIRSESHEHNDLVQEDFLDTYHNLTLKSMAMMKWVNLTCGSNNNMSSPPQWVLKTDDDMLINVDRLLEVVQYMPNSKMIGRLNCGCKPVEDPSSKLYMPKYLYPASGYPGYLSGTGYLVRGNLIPTLLENSLATPLIHLEDIYVTAILARQSQYFPDGSPFFSNGRLKLKNLCRFDVMATSHGYSPDTLRTIWSRLSIKKQLHEPCLREKRIFARKLPRLTKMFGRLCWFP